MESVSTAALFPAMLRDRSMRIFLIIPKRHSILWTTERGNESIARKAFRYRLAKKPCSLISRPDHLHVSRQYFIKPESLAAH